MYHVQSRIIHNLYFFLILDDFLSWLNPCNNYLPIVKKRILSFIWTRASFTKAFSGRFFYPIEIKQLQTDRFQVFVRRDPNTCFQLDHIGVCLFNLYCPLLYITPLVCPHSPLLDWGPTHRQKTWYHIPSSPYLSPFLHLRAQTTCPHLIPSWPKRRCQLDATNTSTLLFLILFCYHQIKTFMTCVIHNINIHKVCSH